MDGREEEGQERKEYGEGETEKREKDSRETRIFENLILTTGIET